MKLVKTLRNILKPERIGQKKMGLFLANQRKDASRPNMLCNKAFDFIAARLSSVKLLLFGF